MKSFYSIVRFVSNPLSKENLAIGLILLSENKIFFKFSKTKIQLSHKINQSNSKLLDYTIDKVSDFIDRELVKDVSLFSKDIAINAEYLNRLSIYNNGFLQFDKPVAINMLFDEVKFNNFFEKYIEISLRKIKKSIVDKSFQRTVKRVFSDPLKNIINIDFKIKKEQIPGLFFDYTLDGIGVNGSIYSVKSIDLNSEKPIDSIRKDISELESLNYRLDLFSKENDLNIGNNNHYLVVDQYKGSKPSYHQLYEILSEQNKYKYPYKVINSLELEEVTASIKKSNNIIKFSELL